MSALNCVSVPWVIEAHSPSRGRCVAEVVRGGVRSQCFRSGHYWDQGQGYCYQHHPDPYAFITAMHSATERAQRAFAKAEGRP